jgi:hypothetical protein
MGHAPDGVSRHFAGGHSKVAYQPPGCIKKQRFCVLMPRGYQRRNTAHGYAKPVIAQHEAEKTKPRNRLRGLPD